jgi:hypothetical protein
MEDRGGLRRGGSDGRHLAVATPLPSGQSSSGSCQGEGRGGGELTYRGSMWREWLEVTCDGVVPGLH